MQLFAQLIYKLSGSTKTNEKLQALVEYFTHGDEKDKVWVIALFSGRRPRRTVSGTQLAVWCTEMVNLPIWLFQECYHTVGDLSETVALLIPEIKGSSSPSIGEGPGEAGRGANLCITTLKNSSNWRKQQKTKRRPSLYNRGWS
jgi:DNA ligase-1